MPTDDKGYAPLTIKKSTKDRLDLKKHLGQSYDGIIQELLDLDDREQQEAKETSTKS